MNILLACSSGITTNLLVNKMLDASLASGRNDKIRAVGQAELDAAMHDSDVLLLGPQMKFLYEKLVPRAQETNTKIGTIPAKMYANIDGEGILKLAIETCENN